MIAVKEFFTYDSEVFLSETEVYETLTVDSILNFDIELGKEGQEGSIIYFKIYYNILCLEKDFDKNKNEIGYLYYLLGYYTGMFYHPANGKDIGLSFLKKALTITNDDTVLKEIMVTITMLEGYP